ncbi:MAG: hypothetical protein O3A10_06795 [Chloroflexi bacterium]|nr:hypothetical protein [Chloroflexota bacterium]MDA1147038.1 hypothetical protein [Chloroflexota bacterium]
MTNPSNPGPEPTIRDATIEDAPAMLEVITAAFECWPDFALEVPPIDHLRWKMASPDGVPLHHSVVLVGDRVAAAQLRWARRLSVRGETRIGETGADLAVHPDFRGQRLSRLISDRDDARLRADRVTGFAMQSNAAQVRHLNRDRITRELDTWVRPFGWRSFVATHRNAGGWGQALRASVRRVMSRTPGLSAAARIEVLDRFDARTDDIWAAARDAYDVIAFRNAEYLNWRFARPVTGHPTILAIFEGDRALAYAVVRHAGGRGDLMDWLWRPDAAAVVPALLGAAISHLQQGGATDVTCWLPRRHDAEQALRAAGFARTGTQEMLFGIRNSAEERTPDLDVYDDPASTLHIAMCDFDWT